MRLRWEGAARLENTALPETNYRKLHWKQVFQHGLTLLAPWMHGHSEAEIAEMIGNSEGDVLRDLGWTLDLIKQREAWWRGNRPPEKSSVLEQMPATTCTRCESAIACGGYRVVVLALSRDRKLEEAEVRDVDVVEATRTLTLCANCVAVMPEFSITNDFKLDIERRAEYYKRPSAPGMDALDSGRASTGHGGFQDTDNQAMTTSGSDSSPTAEGDTFGAADSEALELSEENPQALSEGIAPIQPRSGKEITRERLASFLGDPRSRQKLRPTTRRVAELYVGNLTQCEIARKTGMDQSSVSRAIQAALRLACDV
jgi:hypothetical protein